MNSLHVQENILANTSNFDENGKYLEVLNSKFELQEVLTDFAFGLFF